MSALCNSLTMPLSKPNFQSNVPEYLTLECSPKEKYILEQLSVISQTNNWLVDETVNQSIKLEEVKSQAVRIEEQTRKTNGRVTKLEEKNEGHKETDGHIDQMVSVKKFIEKFIYSKIFWVSFAVFIYFGIQTGFFVGILKWLFGLINLP